MNGVIPSSLHSYKYMAFHPGDGPLPLTKTVCHSGVLGPFIFHDPLGYVTGISWKLAQVPAQWILCINTLWFLSSKGCHVLVLFVCVYVCVCSSKTNKEKQANRAKTKLGLAENNLFTE